MNINIIHPRANDSSYSELVPKERRHLTYANQTFRVVTQNDTIMFGLIDAAQYMVGGRYPMWGDILHLVDDNLWFINLHNPPAAVQPEDFVKVSRKVIKEWLELPIHERKFHPLVERGFELVDEDEDTWPPDDDDEPDWLPPHFLD